MLDKLKYAVYAVIGLAVVYTLITDNDGSDSINRADLDQVLNVASNTLDTFEGSEDVNKDNAMDKFAGSYAQNLNTSQPALSSSAVGVVPNSDGSFDGFADNNNNSIKDSGELDLFNLEIDSENSRLIASDEIALNAWDSDVTGDKGNECSWGMCCREKSYWPDAQDHLWPNDFIKNSKIAPKYKDIGQHCPLDAEPPINGKPYGCFYRCLIFDKKRKTPSRDEVLALYDATIERFENSKK